MLLHPRRRLVPDRLEEVQTLEEVHGLEEEEQEEFHWEPEPESVWDRLFLLLADDAVAHALVFVAAMLFFIDIHLPSTLLMVLLPAFVGALLVLDYGGEVTKEVAKAAVESGLEDVTVDRSLQFSLEGVQSAYHAWMDKLPGVEWHSFFSLFTMQLLIHVALGIKGEEYGCGWKHQGFGLPTTALLTVQTVLAHYKAPMKIQSLVGLIGMIIMKTIGTILVAYKDKCFMSILDTGHESPWMISFGAVVHTFGTHVGYRVDMQHFGVFSAVVFVLITAFTYVRYLQQNGGSDPYLWGFGLVALSNAIATEGAVTARYCLAKLNMTCFLRQAQLTKQQRVLRHD